ncbi:E3 Ubiquitin ligase [Nesidiocoris tenuis]|uniref:RING-type E3 ubiquitin transferase n=1 Tax=Nesidiocoris tenuis TaxID=355587 RepID=A0ABN7AWE7_9HEMI|nr:E3 Ubiquitin ligase [Nesidiocoris tenuis]
MSTHWGEYVALGVDAVVFGVCSSLYWKYSFWSRLVEKAYRLGINPNYEELSPEDRLYVAYQGEIKALGKPISSSNGLDVTGVIQRFTLKEHAITRNSSGFWTDQKNTIKEAYNVVPFAMHRGKIVVQIMDPLSAEILDLDTVYNKFEPSKMGFLDSFIGFFHGIRQRGIETTEEMLKEGSVITAVGEVTLCGCGVCNLHLSASSKGHPYFLTSMPITSLLRKVEEQKTTYKWLTYFFGSVGLAISYIIAKRWWEKRKLLLREEDIRRRLQETRKERRKNARDGRELLESERCVVCQENPKEVIILRCGHVCICEDCSISITRDCPICRSPIEDKAPAFIS